MKNNDKKYYKELAKDVSVFSAGLVAGPIIDFAELVRKHAPVLHKKVGEKIGKKIKFYKEVR